MHNWPSAIRVREGLAGRDILASSRTIDSCGGPGAVCANQGSQVHGVYSTLVHIGAARFRVVFRRTRGFRLSSFVSNHGILIFLFVFLIYF